VNPVELLGMVSLGQILRVGVVVVDQEGCGIIPEEDWAVMLEHFPITKSMPYTERFIYQVEEVEVEHLSRSTTLTTMLALVEERVVRGSLSHVGRLREPQAMPLALSCPQVVQVVPGPTVLVLVEEVVVVQSS
jgi:hypothetical protein